MYFHNTLNILKAGRVTEISSLEGNFLQQLIAMREEVIYEVLRVLRKAYDSLDWEH